MKLFACKHPAASLRVNKDETAERETKYFITVSYHLYCLKCNEPVTIKYARMLEAEIDADLVLGKNILRGMSAHI